MKKGFIKTLKFLGWIVLAVTIGTGCAIVLIKFVDQFYNMPK